MRTLSLVSFVGLITGCCPDDNTEHYTYDDVQLSYSHQDTEQTPIAAGEVFELEVTVPLAARYARRTRCFRLIPRAYAMQECPHEAYRHPEISSLTITSDADYSAAHPAGSDLALMFGVYGSVPFSRFEPFPHRFVEPPTMAKRHTFTVTVAYSEDQESKTLVTQSNVIVWQ